MKLYIILNKVQFDLSTIVPDRHRTGAATIHPYFGKVDPALARYLILHFSQPRECVLDPFCGSGTVLNEALLSGRSAAGWDTSPLAKLIALTKCAGVLAEEKTWLEWLHSELYNYSSEAQLWRNEVPKTGIVPLMPRVLNIQDWFEPVALNELSFLKDFLRQHMGGAPTGMARLLATVAFSRIVIAASNQQGESTYRKVQKNHAPGDVIGLYLRAIHKVIAAAERHNLLRIPSGGISPRTVRLSSEHDSIVWNNANLDIYKHDTRAPEPTMSYVPSLVVTSPPYLMSWDYGLYHKFRFYWLDFDLDAYEEMEIGRHLRRKKDDVAQYQSDMTAAFASIGNAVSQTGTIVLINAPAVVYGKLVDTNNILADAGASAGWRLKDHLTSFDIPGPHHGMYESLTSRQATAPGSRGKKEHVLIFQR